MKREAKQHEHSFRVAENKVRDRTGKPKKKGNAMKDSFCVILLWKLWFGHVKQELYKIFILN